MGGVGGLCQVAGDLVAGEQQPPGDGVDVAEEFAQVVGLVSGLLT